MKKMLKARYRGIPVYYNPNTYEIIGRNIICDFFVFINIYIDKVLLKLSVLPVEIEEER